jgi:biopolymer transport protein TolR
MDLTFILLITFIITFPLIEQGIPVNLPQGKARELTDETARTVTVDAEGRVYLDDHPIGLDELEKVMTTIAAGETQVTVMLRADESIAYGSVVEVLKILNKARIGKMALVTREE